MKASALKEKPVVSMADGAKVGNVRDVLFDTTNLRAEALVLTGSGGQSVLPFGSIRGIGSDAITVESAADTHGSAGQTTLDSLRGLDDLTDLPVVNGEGTHLGQVREIEVQQHDGRLVELSVHRGGMLGIGGTTVTVPAAAIRSIGPKIVTVEMPAETKQEQR